MIYDLKDLQETRKAVDYLAKLSATEQLVEIKRISPNRTLRQNAYLHLIITAFGNNFGYTPDEAKMLYKYINKEIYKYKRHGLPFWRSSADLTKEEMAQSIDRFRAKSAEMGYDLPEADQLAWIRQLQNEVERTRRPVEV